VLTLRGALKKLQILETGSPLISLRIVYQNIKKTQLQMRKYSVRITPSAIDDIEELADFYLELVGEESAARFSQAVIDTIANLDTFPEAHSYFDKEHDLRRVQVKNHKVSVVFTVDNGVYEVVAFGVFHTLSKLNTYTRNLVNRLKELEE
jgi:plasmid stabilization system protein ParE